MKKCKCLNDNREITGTPTGFHQIDDKGGLQKGNFIVIAAETSQGKTSFAQSVTLNALDYGSKIAYYSLEMQNYELTSRLISMRSEVCSSGLLYDKLGDEQLMKVNDAINKLWDKNLYYDDRSTSNIDIIISSIRNIHNIGYYLVSSGNNECEDVSEILSKARESLDKINDKKTDQYINLNDSIQTVYDRIKSNLNDNREITGTPTGLS